MGNPVPAGKSRRRTLKLAAAVAQMLDLPVEVCGLVLGPRQPRPQMLKAGINGRFEQRCIGGLPTPQHQPLRVDAICWPLPAGSGAFPVCLLHFHNCSPLCPATILSIAPGSSTPAVQPTLWPGLRRMIAQPYVLIEEVAAIP